MKQGHQNFAANMAMSEGRITLELPEIPREAIRAGIDAAYR